MRKNVIAGLLVVQMLAGPACSFNEALTWYFSGGTPAETPGAGTPTLVCNDGTPPHIVQPGEHLLNICRAKNVAEGECTTRVYRPDNTTIEDPDIIHAGDPLCFDIIEP